MMATSRATILEGLFTPEEIQRLCDPCRHADHYRDWPDRGAHAPEMMLMPPARRCPCDLRCMQAHPDWGRGIGTFGCFCGGRR